VKTSEVLRAAREQLSDPAKWWKGERPQAEGTECAFTVMYGGGHGLEASRHLRDALGVTSLGALFRWNDDPATTHDDLMALYDRAIEIAEAEEGVAA
jgi:hypothetical protein